MLTESFVVSLGNASDKAKLDPSKDVSIAIIEHQPVVQQRTSFKKSSSPQNCLAISSSHIFAAQTDKAVVNVYNRSKGNHEATVPFTEKITCITLACNDTVLVVGTAEGRLFLWETATGRQVTTTQSHLQTVTCLVVDHSSHFLVSTSADTTAKVWTLPALLSFEADFNTPSTTTYDGHRAGITAVALGHSASFTNLAATIAQDQACMIWDYHTASTIYTFLLSAIPTCITFDPADRAAYIGYHDGSIQQLDLLHTKKSTSAIQPGDNKKWSSPDTSHGAVLTLACTFDSTSVITGHESGSILSWDISNGHMRTLPIQPPFTRGVTSLQLLPVFDRTTPSYTIESIVKPKFGAFQTSSNIPGNYAAQAHLNTAKSVSAFHSALTAPVIPTAWLEQGLQEISTWKADVSEVKLDDFMPLTNDKHEAQEELKQEVIELQQQLQAIRQTQKISLKHLQKMTAERNALLNREQQRMLNGED